MTSQVCTFRQPVRRFVAAPNGGVAGLGWGSLDVPRRSQQPLIIIVSHQVPANLRSTMAVPGTFTALHIAVTALVTAAAGLPIILWQLRPTYRPTPPSSPYR